MFVALHLKKKQKKNEALPALYYVSLSHFLIHMQGGLTRLLKIKVLLPDELPHFMLLIHTRTDTGVRERGGYALHFPRCRTPGQFWCLEFFASLYIYVFNLFFFFLAQDREKCWNFRVLQWDVRGISTTRWWEDFLSARPAVLMWLIYMHHVGIHKNTSSAHHQFLFRFKIAHFERDLLLPMLTVKHH